MTVKLKKFTLLLTSLNRSKMNFLNVNFLSAQNKLFFMYCPLQISSFSPV